MAVLLNQVPEEIREYLASEQTTVLINGIRDEADVVLPGALPKLLFRLETKDLSVHDFVEAIERNLGVKPPKSLAIAKAIKERVLEPKRYTLSQWGVDISFLDVAQAPNLGEFRPFEAPGAASEPEKISLEQLTTETGQNVPVQEETLASSANTAEQTKEGAPLILHREETLTGEKKSSIRGFSFPGFFKSKKTEAESPPTVKVKIETPGQGPDKEKRVVHYSEFRTPVTPFNENNELINLEVFSKKTTEPIKTSPPVVGGMAQKNAPSEPIAPETKEGLIAGQNPNLGETTKEEPSQEKKAKNLLWFGKSGNENGRPAAATAKPAEKAETSKNRPSIEGNIIDLR